MEKPEDKSADKPFALKKPVQYGVNEDCIACDACVLVAPRHFKIDEEKSVAYVALQPQNKKEYELCEEALEACPGGSH